jgi:hypothetical protein
MVDHGDVPGAQAWRQVLRAPVDARDALLRAAAQASVEATDPGFRVGRGEPPAGRATWETCGRDPPARA